MGFRTLLVLGLGILTISVFSSVYAETASELRAKISQKDSDIAKLEQEIASYQSELADLGREKDSLSNAIKELDLTKKKLNTEIAVTQNKIEKTNLRIKDLSADIGNKEESIRNNIKVMSSGIKATSELENSTLLATLLSEKDFSEAWKDIDTLAAVRERVHIAVQELKNTKIELEDTKEAEEDVRNELTSLRKRLSDQQKIVTDNTNAKNKLLAQTKNSEASYQKLLTERIALKDQFERELEAYESQLKYILDPSAIPSGRLLSWPLDKVYITSPYGPRSFGSGFHYGLDFRASVGTPVRAMADGVVEGVGDTDVCCPGASFGKWIFVEFNNGLSSTYGHLSLISVRKGQKVKRGEVIGYSGNTGSSTGPHLHISLYVSSGVKIDSFASKSYPGKTLVQPRIHAVNAHLDPEKYLPPR